MLNKTVGYSGFRTYGELPYPTRKQGKQLQLANKVWESTVRQVDHKSALENYKNSQTIYKKHYIENTHPQNYHPEHVPKGGARTLDFPSAGSIKAYDKQEARRYGGRAQSKDDDRKNKFLQTGTEHWKTNYGKANQKANERTIERANSTFKANSTTNDWNSSKVGNSDNKNAGTTNSSQMRGNSVGGKSAHQLAEEEGRAKSYKNRAYINNAKTGITDYKFNYGQKIGSTPLDLMNRVSLKQPLRDHPLKRGTNQLWSQIPCYQGFKPSELPFKEYKNRIEQRKEINKGGVKLQVTNNFLVNVPGYGGYKPQYQNQNDKLRDSCLATK